MLGSSDDSFLRVLWWLRLLRNLGGLHSEDLSRLLPDGDSDSGPGKQKYLGRSSAGCQEYDDISNMHIEVRQTTRKSSHSGRCGGTSRLGFSRRFFISEVSCTPGRSWLLRLEIHDRFEPGTKHREKREHLVFAIQSQFIRAV